MLGGLSGGVPLYNETILCYQFTEAEYTYRLQKDIIPLLLQPHYAPDGWLGMLAGTKLYFDFSDERNIDVIVPKLIKELDNRGKLSATSLREQKDHIDAGNVYILMIDVGLNYDVSCESFNTN